MNDLTRERMKRVVSEQLLAIEQHLDNLETTKINYLDGVRDLENNLIEYEKKKRDCEIILEDLEREREFH